MTETIEPILTIKIKRHEYQINEDDSFMDNGLGVQLMSQSGEFERHGRALIPKLTARNVKELSKFERVELRHGYGKGISLFSIKRPA